MLYRIQSTALGQSGNSLVILPNALITVRDKIGALTRIYADAGEVTELTNPTSADSAGGYDIYVAYDDYYDISITLNGQTVDDRIYPIEIGLGAQVAADAGTASTQAGVATTQAGISTAQAVIATTKAGEAATSAAQAALYDGVWLDNEAAVLADVVLTYAVGANQVIAGEYILTRKEGFVFEVADSAATNNDEVTAGGVKLNKLNQSALVSEGLPAPTSPTATVNPTAGNLNGSYSYRVTFMTDDGETRPSSSPVGATASPVNQQVDLTIPVSTNWRVTGRKIYRTIGSGGDPVQVKLVATIADNTTTAFTDNVADGSLGVAAHYVDKTGSVVRSGTEIIAAAGTLATVFGANTLPGGGYASTAIGTNSLSASVDGVRNTALGHDSLKSTTTGSSNTAAGVHAGNDNTTGSNNVYMGYSASFSNNSGSDNVAIGVFSNATTTVGDQNVAIGSSAMQLRTGGDFAIAIGFQAMMRGSGNSNIAIGDRCMNNLTTGFGNISIGRTSAPVLSSGVGNTLLGGSSGTRLTSGGSNVFLGLNSGAWVTTESNQLFIDNQTRASYADSQEKALVYGVFGGNRSNQQYHVNGRLFANAGFQLPATAITADYSPSFADHTINITGTGSITLTLTNPANVPGKIYHIRNKAAFAVVSSGANIIPLAGGGATTSILPATAGAWVQIQAIGAFWEIIAS